MNGRIFHLRRPAITVVTILALSIILGLLLNSCRPVENPRLKVVTTTSLLTYIAERIGRDSVNVISIIPPTHHPGDFDAKPGDIQQLADADLFLWHNWPGEVFVPGLIESADNPELTVITIEIKGNWMTPQVQIQAADKVAVALSQVDSRNSTAYEKRAAEYKDMVSAKEAEIRALLAEAKPSDVRVLVSFWQAGFASWAGFEITGTYGPAAPTIDATRELVDKGREAGVTLVIDNLQSGPDTGKAVAEELGAHRVILSNFPGSYEAGGSWEDEIDHNIGLIMEVISR